MIEISTNMQIGLGLTGMGIAFIFLGFVFLFDKGLLVIGNLMFIAGLFFIIGFQKTFIFFIQSQRRKGTAVFIVGIFALLMGHPIVGALTELAGLYYIFRGFIPTAFQYVTSYVPFLGSVTRNRTIV